MKNYTQAQIIGDKKKPNSKKPSHKHTQAQMNIIFKICAQAQTNNKPLKRTTEAQIIAHDKKTETI